MDRDEIKEVGIDEEGRLYVVPSKKAFPYMYREALEVHWDSDLKRLYGPKPRKWGYSEWYIQILNAAQKQSCILELTEATVWLNVSQDTKASIQGG